MKPIVIAPVLSVEECSRKCLLSPACDMVDFSSTTCKFYPFIKLKGRIASQVPFYTIDSEQLSSFWYSKSI